MRVFDPIVVGNRGTAQVLVTAGDPPTLQTGWLGDRVIGSPSAPGVNRPDLAGQNPGNNHVDHYRGQVTATVTIRESVPGVLTTGWSSPINFEFGEGVNILGAVVHAGTNTANNNIINKLARMA